MYWDGNVRPVRKIPVRVSRDQEIIRSQLEQTIESDESAGPSSVSANHGIASQAATEHDWQSLALRLQADMDNFRKRQVRRADDAIAVERERLLRLMLPVADNLARALDQDEREDGTLRQGVELTYRELMRFLEMEGITRVEGVGQAFTPEWHEAVGTAVTDAEAGVVVEELEGGYRLGEKLLRPARVIVAV